MNLLSWWTRVSIPYERLSLFAGNLATCLEAGLALPASLETSSRALSGTHLADAMRIAVVEVRAGKTLCEALSVARDELPAFFVPVLSAGETTGQLDTALRYLEDHCRLLARPAQALRNAWLLPLAVALFGTFVKLLAHLGFASWSATFRFVWGSLVAYGTLAIIVFVAVGSPCRPLVDLVKLHLPFVSSIERKIANNRFFHALAMLHATAGHRVEQMIRIAASTVSNVVLRADFEQVAHHIEQGDAIPDAFRVSQYLSPLQHELIATGDLSGTLESSYQRIAEEAATYLQERLQVFQTWFVRVTMLIVVYSAVHTAATLIVLSRR